ncbi:MAG: molybdopterin-dependent oxidoreductase [Deinococcota bacterium]
MSDAHTDLSHPALLDKDPSLQCHDNNPLQVETPLTALQAHDLTPVPALYIRNNQTQLPEIPSDAKFIVHSPQGTAVCDLALLYDLKTQGHWQETTMVLQCAGNNRNLFDAMAHVAGSLWDSGAIANVAFAGVPVKEVFKALSLTPDVFEDVFLTALGYVTGEDIAFERSVPLADVWESAFVALELNGKPLNHLHGGPVRLVVPGYYAVNSVKWLAKLGITDTPTQGFYQTSRYRLPHEPLTPGDKFTPSEDNSRPSWRQKVKSLFWDQEKALKAGIITLTGIAWTDGRSHITKVELSFDRGEHWEVAMLTPSTSSYSWTRWEFEKVFSHGTVGIWLRATDSNGNTQPLTADNDWNPRGYEWNAVQKLKLTIL